jgi:hypothetical protein
LKIDVDMGPLIVAEAPVPSRDDAAPLPTKAVLVPSDGNTLKILLALSKSPTKIKSSSPANEIPRISPANAVPTRLTA